MTKTLCSLALAATFALTALPSSAEACGGYGDFQPTEEMRAEQAVWVALDRLPSKSQAVSVNVTLTQARRGIAAIQFAKGAKTRVAVVKVKDRWTVRPLPQA